MFSLTSVSHRLPLAIMTTPCAPTEELNISLESHLIEALQPLLHILPEDVSSNLQDLVQRERPQSPTIPYSLLASISDWARTPDGERALASHEPPLLSADYSMIALLAGTRTSPERKFPTYVARSDDADGRMTYSDRRAVTSVLNALLSIGGAGAATWWAAGRLAWKDQWVCSYFLRGPSRTSKREPRKCY